MYFSYYSVDGLFHCFPYSNPVYRAIYNLDRADSAQPEITWTRSRASRALPALWERGRQELPSVRSALL